MLNKIFDINIAINNFWFILSGLGYTLGVALTSFVFGTILGFVLVLMRRSRFRLLRWIATFHVSFMRGTPTLVFLFLLYFGLPFLKITLPALVCALLCFSIAVVRIFLKCCVRPWTQWIMVNGKQRCLLE